MLPGLRHGERLVANSLGQHPQAMLTFESENHVGAEAIQGKLGVRLDYILTYIYACATC